MTQSHVAANIRAEMGRSGKTQGDLAELLGITRQAVSRRLIGLVDFRLSELQAIATYLDVPTSALIGDERASA